MTATVIITSLAAFAIIFLLFAFCGYVKVKDIKFTAASKNTEKWTVRLYKHGHEDAVMDEVYLYTLDFIYGDRNQKRIHKTKTFPYTRQDIGTGLDNDPGAPTKIQFFGKGVASTHGSIRYVQDYGLVYFDGTHKYRKDDPHTPFKPACTGAPYGSQGCKPIYKTRPITDGLRLFIGDTVLCFEKSNISYQANVEEDCDPSVCESDIDNDDYSLMSELGDIVAKFSGKLCVLAYKGLSATLKFISNLMPHHRKKKQAQAEISVEESATNE